MSSALERLTRRLAGSAGAYVGQQISGDSTYFINPEQVALFSVTKKKKGGIAIQHNSLTLKKLPSLKPINRKQVLTSIAFGCLPVVEMQLPRTAKMKLRLGGQE